MAGLDLEAVAEALADAVAAASGVRRAYPLVPERISETPCAYVAFPERVTYSTRFGKGAAEAEIPVTLVAGRVNADDAQLWLLRFASNRPPADVDDPVGVVDAIQADRTLGGLVSTLVVSENRNTRAVADHGGGQFIVTDFVVTVTAPKGA